ncbi:hypothetical protein SAMN05216588_1355 [Pseudomonas flavescens]|uniref:Lipoprotein n=1 Tax=Phytopseudomonas flavescens TaxID=29435 RepID=A0A1G8QFE4_9GAMM|nr:hypothetical protein [Pseudomonas flavescens]SDJ03358.1 hypothetical protein SAMN05216588_1355 [Pseudomonas flavescens]
MIRKSMLVALLGFALTGCAVYGDSGYGGYRDYDRQYYPGAHVQRYETYGAPRVYVYEDRRYERRYSPPRYYAPPPPPRYFSQPGHDARYHGRHERNRRDYRPTPRPGWEGQRHHYQQQPRNAPLERQQREAPQRLQRGWTSDR